MDVTERNNRYFTEHLEDYRVSYLRPDELYLTRYFGKKVLILGCGAGRTFEGLSRMGFDITGVDVNEDMVREAKKYGVQVLRADAVSLPFPDKSFDTVFFPFHGIDYVYPDIYRAVVEVRRVLRDGGVFVLSSHNRLFLKKLHLILEGKYINDHGLMTYRTTPWDWLKLRRYFKKVRMIQRISIAVSWKDANWKDRLYKLLPLFNKSTYFVCFA